MWNTQSKGNIHVKHQSKRNTHVKHSNSPRATFMWNTLSTGNIHVKHSVFGQHSCETLKQSKFWPFHFLHITVPQLTVCCPVEGISAEPLQAVLDHPIIKTSVLTFYTCSAGNTYSPDNRYLSYHQASLPCFIKNSQASWQPSLLASMTQVTSTAQTKHTTVTTDHPYPMCSGWHRASARTRRHLDCLLWQQPSEGFWNTGPRLQWQHINRLSQHDSEFSQSLMCMTEGYTNLCFA